MACLNRLGEIVRFKTKFYFIERIFEHDIFLFNVDTEDYTGKERTAAAGMTNISRNIAQSVSPSLAGYILQSLSFLSAPFVLGGVLKIVYDIALYLQFKRYDIKD
ncbi:MAG: hypothetical protein ACJ72C_05960 [Nitrososphaeraceae archaeon]